MPFRYKTVLVIGATSGIDLALAEKIIANGSHMIALGRRQENLDILAKKHGSDKVSTVKFDITDLEGIPDMVSNITKAHPTLDCVVLNSGIQRSLNFARPETIDLDFISTEFTTNYFSHLHLTKALPPFPSRHASAPTTLMYVTSALALTPFPRCGNYSASKAAMHAWILVLRTQLAASPSAYSHAKVVEIMPPAVQTELHDPKHQPDLAGGKGPVGMPLVEFTERAWAQLAEGKEQVFVGVGERSWERWEGERQREFGNLVRLAGWGRNPLGWRW